MHKVTVTASESGSVINVSENNPDYGYIRVEQKKATFDKNGWARVRMVSALIPGTTEDLKALGWTAGMQLEGTIYATEQLEPFNAEDPEKDYKIAGDTGIVCCLDGQPIYRRSFYSSDPSKTDTLISHNNGDAIKEAYAKSLAEADSDEDVSLG